MRNAIKTQEAIRKFQKNKENWKLERKTQRA